jgi:hypothetical protein
VFGTVQAALFLLLEQVCLLSAVLALGMAAKLEARSFQAVEVLPGEWGPGLSVAAFPE